MNNKIPEQNIQGNRNYKDSLFRMIFEKKEDLLELYNAINGTSYDNPEELEVNTLENALYMGMKNDVSFLIGHTMNLYEHQSSKNENMPLRGLIYLTRQFENYIAERKINLHSSKLQELPTPRYIVFYNGKADEPDERIMKLSDAFTHGSGCLECMARLLNINYGHNLELMKKCKPLEEYAMFIQIVRQYQADERYSLEQAISLAIDESVKKGILEDILVKQRNEVFSVILSTFDKELYEKDLREEAFDEGYDKGAYDKLCELVNRKLSKGKKSYEIAEELEESLEVIDEIVKELKRVKQ